MQTILPTKAQINDSIEAIARQRFCARPAQIGRGLAHLLKLPDRISTVECAEKHRKFRSPEGGALVPYDRTRTPYNVGPMDALDDPDCNLVVMVKPSRSGGTTVAENYLFKMMLYGPMATVGWYLNSDDAVKKYVDLIWKAAFEDHPELARKVGSGRSDNNDKSKRIAGYLVEWLSAADGNFRNREPMLMVLDETDGMARQYAASPITEIEARQKNLGNRRKAIVMSHPDLGWRSGVAAAWIDTSRGIYVMRCAECGDHAAAHATRFWPEIPEFRLFYERNTDAPRDERLAMAERTAAMVCPHCGSALTDEQRRDMIDDGRWLERGMEFDAATGVSGEIDPMVRGKRGFWVHGLMLKVSSQAELAKGLEAGVIKFETTRKSDDLKAFKSKQLGEIYEGGDGRAMTTAAALRRRAEESENEGREDHRFKVGTCPPEVKFITAAVDVGGSKFDISFRGWDLENRSWWLDRITLKQRLWPDGVTRDLRPADRIEDWTLLYEAVLDRMFPIVGRDGWAMPVAAVAVDTGGKSAKDLEGREVGVTWKARAFARMAVKAGYYWGRSDTPWPRVRLIKGAKSPEAQMLPETPRKIDRDEFGQAVKPVLLESDLGVHRLKALSRERLSIDDGGPGQCYFAQGIPQSAFEEYFGENLIDKEWVRSGPNESLDLFGYEEAARQMLRPDRADLWTGAVLPAWATPVEIAAAGTAAKAKAEQPEPDKPKKSSALQRFENLNRS